MGNHYVPQFYLKGFSGESDYLWAHDRLAKKSFKSNIKNVAQENGGGVTPPFEPA